VLASGSGSNLQAILDHFAALGPSAPGEVVLVVSDRAGAGALDRARHAGIATAHLAAREPQRLLPVLREAGVTHVVLAGYLRLIPADVVAAFHGRLVNIHPALLPAFGGPGMYGHHVHEAVVRAGVATTGATVHFVDERYDEGAVIAQWAIPVHPTDDADAVAARVLAVEHQLYPRCVAALCEGSVRLEHGQVVAAPLLPFERFVPADVPPPHSV
jgi:formyltetrahydrofolate-dependent phosphoribosylglycinamide formyltransferase